MQETVRAAVVQAASCSFDTSATLDKVEQLTAEAAAGGAELVVFPEAFVGAYPRGFDFGVSVGMRAPEAYAQFQRYAAGAIEVPSPETRRIGAAARQHKSHLVLGIIERGGGTLYCTVLFFGPDGQLLGKHRKLMPTQMERVLWGFGDGSTLPVFDTPLGRLGAVICWENYMPLLRMAMYQKGVQLYCAPTADGRESWVPSMQHVAVEGRCFVLAANQLTHRKDYPEDWHNHISDDPAAEIATGRSCIVDPFGRLLAGPLVNQEGILFADLDMKLIERGKWDFDVTGHYARPDIFRLIVNEAPQTSTEFQHAR